LPRSLRLYGGNRVAVRYGWLRGVSTSDAQLVAYLSQRRA